MDSMEDRFARNGTHARFAAAHKAFKASDKQRPAQLQYYEELEICGASPEEADEWINMLLDEEAESYL